MTRALFVNSGMAGHKTFAGVMKQVASQMPGIDAQYLDLSHELAAGERLLRWLLSLSITPRTGPVANLDLRRWRQELNIGWLAARRIGRARRRARFDVLHFYTQPAAYASVGLMKQIPSIVCLDCTQRQASLEVESRLSRASYYANILHDGRVFRAASAIVATSEWAARDLRELYPDCASKVSVLPVPVDVDAFSGDWIAERARRARAVKDYRPRVLFIGGDFPRKGGPDLFEAWRAGGFADRADLHVVTDWSIPAETVPPGATIVTGIAPYTGPWLELWRRADLFVMPARHEAFGIVYQEAGASGIPAIGSDMNAIPEILRDGGTGFLVPPGNREALVRALATLVDSPVLRERMGRAARQYVTERASVPVYAAKLGSVIGNVVTIDVRQPA
jgi:starch synthase